MKICRKLVCAVALGSIALFGACGKDEDISANGNKESVSEDDLESKSATNFDESNSGNIQETTDGGIGEADNDVEKVIDGFYNCYDSEQPYERMDFEIKTTEDGYVALAYSKYSDMDIYGTGPILYGEKTGDRTFEFTAQDGKYIVTWDGEDKLTVDGTWFSGEYERGVKDGYGEDDYMIADIPSYEADKNVEAGIEIDSVLAKAVRNELGYSADAKLTYDDLKQVTYLAIWEGDMVSLKGISLLENLEEIHIGMGYISDISEMGQLKYIRFIDITRNYIQDISPLSKCGNLESLYLSGNMIVDVSPLADMTLLRYVDLNCNGITSIKPLEAATSIETLNIEMNCILDYADVKDCETLVNAYNKGAQGSFEEALALENRAKEIVASFPSELSELELEKVIYKYIIENMYYSEEERPTGAFGYSGIMNGWGVCGDYADAFTLLANHAGLEAMTCSSETHAWNIVKIDGVYYHCDTLWDENVVEWCHFNKSTGYMYNLPDHMHDLRRYPICDISMSVLEYYDCFGVE